MKRFLLVLILLMLAAPCLRAQSPSQRSPQADASKFRIHPTRSKTFPTGIYIPCDLPDTFVELQKMLAPALLADMRRGAERDMLGYHFGLGMWLRNNWGLWKGLRLAQWFNKQGIFHPDDMSGIILASFWRHLNHKPIDLRGQVTTCQAYWKQAEIADRKEKKRVRQAQAAIRSRMAGMIITGKPQQMLTLPPRPISGLRIRYIAPFANGVLLTAKISRGVNDDNFTTPCFFLDLQQRVVHPIRLPEITRIEEGVVIGGKAYFHGTTNGANVVLEVEGQVHNALPLPPGDGALQLGIDHDHLLAIRPHSVNRWAEGQWQSVYRGSVSLPRCGVPPQLIGLRLYFRDERQRETDKRLSWLNLSDPRKLIYFDEDTGLVGSDGPRWENVWSYLARENGSLWIAAGSSIVASSLLTWNQSDAYHIALFNAQTNFSNDFFSDPPTDAQAEPTSADVTGMEVQADSSLLAIGSRGLYHIQGTTIHPILAFTNTHRNWTPTHLLTLDANTWLAGAHWGGLYMLEKQTNGKYRLFSLDEEKGAEITL